MEEPDFLLFASDATLAAVAAGACLLLALVASVAEWRRMRRRDLNRVGWVPWTTVFVIAFMTGLALLLVAMKGWASGG